VAVAAARLGVVVATRPLMVTAARLVAVAVGVTVVSIIVICTINADDNAATQMTDDEAADNGAAMQMMDNISTTMLRCRQQRRDADGNSAMQMMGNDADNNDTDNGADNNADVDTDDNTATQMMDDDADNNTQEVKTIGGTLEAKMGRGGGCWGCRGGHLGRQGGLE
jgi:hypothetical protein